MAFFAFLAVPPLIPGDIDITDFSSNPINGADIIFGKLIITQGTLYPGTATTPGTLVTDVIYATSASFGDYVSSSSVLGPVTAAGIFDTGAFNVIEPSVLSAVTAANIFDNGRLNVSGPSVLSAVTVASLYDNGPLTVLGPSVLSAVTATDIYDTGSLTVLGPTNLSSVTAGSIYVTSLTVTAGFSGPVSLPFAMFYGLTAGTGSGGTDYAATIPAKTTAGTGRVPFPRLGAASVGGPTLLGDNASVNLLQ